MLSSNNLYHYTNTKENLLSIIENGFQPRYSLEKLGIDIKNKTLLAISHLLESDNSQSSINDEFAIPMCCFCDIPLNLVDNHRTIYGNYAIGLKKDWGERQALSPVIYLPEDGETRVLFEKLVKNHQNYINGGYVKLKNSSILKLHELFDAIVDLTMFVKPYSGFFEKGLYKNENHKFYDEREWRYKPSKMLCKSYMTKEEFNSFSSSETRNQQMEYIKFDLFDITDIIVPEEEVDEFRELILKMPKFKLIDTGIIDTIKNKI